MWRKRGGSGAGMYLCVHRVDTLRYCGNKKVYCLLQFEFPLGSIWSKKGALKEPFQYSTDTYFLSDFLFILPFSCQPMTMPSH